jgi:hypothetical protein
MQLLLAKITRRHVAYYRHMFCIVKCTCFESLISATGTHEQTNITGIREDDEDAIIEEDEEEKDETPASPPVRLKRLHTAASLPPHRRAALFERIERVWTLTENEKEKEEKRDEDGKGKGNNKNKGRSKSNDHKRGNHKNNDNDNGTSNGNGNIDKLLKVQAHARSWLRTRAWKGVWDPGK